MKEIKEHIEVKPLEFEPIVMRKLYVARKIGAIIENKQIDDYERDNLGNILQFGTKKELKENVKQKKDFFYEIVKVYKKD